MLQLQLDIGKKNEVITIICIVMIKNGLNGVDMFGIICRETQPSFKSYISVIIPTIWCLVFIILHNVPHSHSHFVYLHKCIYI